MAPHSESFPGLLEEYLKFLEHHRGLREATLYFHRRWGERFLRHLAEHLPGRDLARLTIPIMDAFVLPLARSVGRDTQLLRNIGRASNVRVVISQSFRSARAPTGAAMHSTPAIGHYRRDT